MRASHSGILKGVLVAAVAAGALAASNAGAATKTYVVCNRWDECWRVHEHYTTYPSDVGVVWHDDAWYAAHEHDTHWHWLNDPANDHGWYDKDGVWHPFATP
ncbi:MAG: hypothetical protein ACYC8V_04685 [Caulobacteraceae bacterium]